MQEPHRETEKERLNALVKAHKAQKAALESEALEQAHEHFDEHQASHKHHHLSHKASPKANEHQGGDLVHQSFAPNATPSPKNHDFRVKLLLREVPEAELLTSEEQTPDPRVRK